MLPLRPCRRDEIHLERGAGIEQGAGECKVPESMFFLLMFFLAVHLPLSRRLHAFRFKDCMPLATSNHGGAAAAWASSEHDAISEAGV